MRQGRLAAVLLAACALASAPAGAAAQEAPDTTALGGALRQHGVCPGGTVRVAAPGVQVQGRCDGLLDARLLVWSGGATRRVPLAAVDSVWVRRGGFDRGARTGAIAGGLAGGAWGYVLMSSYCGGSTECGGGVILGTVGAAAVGSLVGILVGGALGSTTRRWVRIHPRP